MARWASDPACPVDTGQTRWIPTGPNKDPEHTFEVGLDLLLAGIAATMATSWPRPRCAPAQISHSGALPTGQADDM
jgi:hypothetical protein